MRWVVAVGIGPLLLALIGLTHPQDLSAATATQWTALHVVAVPVFPLLGMSLWLLLRGESGAVAWVARIAAFVYACFYEALDAVDGIAAGVTIRTSPQYQLGPLFTLGDTLGLVGTSAFLLGTLLTSALLVRRHGRAALPGAALTVLAAVSFLDSHIFWPRGVLTMLALAVGLSALAWTGVSGGRPRWPRRRAATTMGA